VSTAVSPPTAKTRWQFGSPGDLVGPLGVAAAAIISILKPHKSASDLRLRS
jgi:hypothetical protein